MPAERETFSLRLKVGILLCRLTFSISIPVKVKNGKTGYFNVVA